MNEGFLHLARQCRWWALGLLMGLAAANLAKGHVMWTLTVGIAAGSLGAIVAAEARTRHTGVVRDGKSLFRTHSLARLLFALLFLVPAGLAAAAKIYSSRIVIDEIS